MRLVLLLTLLLLPCGTAAASPDWPDATPTAWHQLARAEALLSAPEPPNPVAVCVVDSGVNLTPDLAPVVIERLAYDGGDPGDTYPQEGIDDGHGTYVATFLAGQVNGWGGAGLWPRAKIVSVRVFPPGGVRAKAPDYIRAINTCAHTPGVGVINLSLNDIDANAADLAELEDRINQVRLVNNINVVAAAGNRGGAVEVPAHFDAVFAVAAADPDGRLCSFSARGPEVDVLAPGCSLAGSDLQGRPAFFSGSSFAAPQVAAMLAALRSYNNLDSASAERVVLENARGSSDGLLVDIRQSLTSIGVESSGWLPRPMRSELPAERAIQNGSDFLEYPPPRFSVRQNKKKSGGIYLQIRNRPIGAVVQIADSARTREIAANRFAWTLRRHGAQVRLRFISDRGFSSWAQIARSRVRGRG